MPRSRSVLKDYVCKTCYPNQTHMKAYYWRAGWRVSANINAHRRKVHNNEEIEVIIFKKDKDGIVTSKVERR